MKAPLIAFIHCVILHCIVVVCAATVNAFDDEQYCTSASDGSHSEDAVLFFENASVVFNQGISVGHSFIVKLCNITNQSPPGKSRYTVSSAAVAKSCQIGGFLTQFGGNDSNVGCEAVFDTALEPCIRVNNSVRCVFSTSWTAQPILAEVTIECERESNSADGAMMVWEFGGGPVAHFYAKSDSVCISSGVHNPRSINAADIIVATLCAVVGTAFVYISAHNFFVGKRRGWDVLPFIHTLRRRTAPADEGQETQVNSAQREYNRISADDAMDNS